MPQRFSYSSSLSALTIVLVSLAPVLLLHGIIARCRPGASVSRSAEPRGRGMGIAGREISHENAGVGLAISAQSG